MGTIVRAMSGSRLFLAAAVAFVLDRSIGFTQSQRLLVLALLALGLLGLLLAAMLTALFVSEEPPLTPSQLDSEACYTDEHGARRRFPSLSDVPTLTLSVVVPSYNERERLPGMLRESTEYLQQRQRADSSFTWEIVVVDDGSKDSVHQVVAPFTKALGADAVRLMTLAINQGKGGAVRKGILVARGRYIYMADADSAALMSELPKLEECMAGIEEGGHGVAIGSRAHLQTESVAQRKWYRTLLMIGFHGLVKY